MELDAAMHTTFSRWVADRSHASLSTNAGTDELAFQGWRKFKEAFAPELVAKAIQETEAAAGRIVSRVVDPFGGSGTTALACQFLGKQASTIEVNPYLADLIEAKLTSYDYLALSEVYLQVLADRTTAETPTAWPPTFVQPGVNGRYLYTRDAATRFASILSSIDRHADDLNIRRLLRVTLVGCAIELSNVVISGKGRRYRSNWHQRQALAVDVELLFRSSMERVLYDIRRFGKRAEARFSLVRGDARALVHDLAPFDLALFSPPYPNSFDYTDVYNVELWVGGYLRSSEDNFALRNQTLRSHVQVKRDYEGKHAESSLLVTTLDRLSRVRGELWSRDIPEMVRAYFVDMSGILRALRARLAPDGRIYMVVGDSKYAGIPVPVAAIFKEMSTSLGLRVLNGEPIRSMRSSPQQGGQPELAETIFVMEPC